MGKPLATTLPALAVIAAGVIWLVLRDHGERRSGLIAQAQSAQGLQRPQRVAVSRARAQRAALPECGALDGGGLSCGACREDSDCPGDMFCRVGGQARGGEPLRRCVLAGVRPEGAACESDNASDSAVSCGKDLLCVQGGCAPRCHPAEPDEPDACPGGVPCVRTPDGWGCTPSCVNRECGGGKQCLLLSVESPIALCTHQVGDNCLHPGRCAADQDCVVETNPRAERTTFECVARCNPGVVGRSCAMGSVCIRTKGTGQCRRACAPGGPGSCRAGERCVQAPGSGDTWFCTTL
jgi:hypothetical protein